MATAFDRRLSALRSGAVSLPSGRSWKLVIKRGVLYLYWTTDTKDAGVFALENTPECHRKTVLGGQKQSERGLKYRVAIVPGGWLLQDGKPVVNTQPITVGMQSQQFCIQLSGGNNCLMNIQELFQVLHSEIDNRTDNKTDHGILHNVREEDPQVRPFVRAIRLS